MVSRDVSKFAGKRTVERRVHTADVDQQTHHGHTLGSFAVAHQLISQDFTRFRASSHGVDVEVCKRLLGQGLIVRVGKDLLVVVEDGLEKVELNINSP